MQYLTLDYLLLWFIFSLFVTLIWSLIMGDPGVSDTENLIITVICGILALPVTIIFTIILFTIKLIMENKK